MGECHYIAPPKIGQEKDRQNLNAIQGTCVHVIFRSRQMIFLFTNPVIFLEFFFKTGQEKRDFLKKFL